MLEWVAARQLPEDRAAEEWADDHLDQMTRDRFGSQALHLAGPGAPVVEEDEAYEISAALGLSRQSGSRYVGELIELRYRLQRVWSRVIALDLPLWKARKIAAATCTLPEAGAAYVDAQLAWAAARTTLAQIDRTVDEAMVRFAPELLPEDPSDHRDVLIDLDPGQARPRLHRRAPGPGRRPRPRGRAARRRRSLEGSGLGRPARRPPCQGPRRPRPRPRLVGPAAEATAAGRECGEWACHVEPYADGGPTSTANLAPLCRTHHRMKTHARWRYGRRPDGVFVWTGPMGQVFTVDDRTHPDVE